MRGRAQLGQPATTAKIWLMRIHVIGTETNYTKTYEGEGLEYKLVNGFAKIFQNGQEIAAHNGGTWASVAVHKD